MAGGGATWGPVYDSATDLYFKLYKTAPANVRKINIGDSWKVIGVGTATVDSCASYNYYNPLSTGTSTSDGQSFTASVSCNISSAAFYLLRTATAPTGSAYAKIYAHTGTYGTSSLPTGTALATSDAFDVSAVTTSAALYTFTFSGANQIALTAGTHYVIQLEFAGGSGSVYLRNAFYYGSGAHSGNGNYNKTTTTADDMRFYLYGSVNNVQKINIGGVWKDIVAEKINVGGVWKDIF